MGDSKAPVVGFTQAGHSQPQALLLNGVGAEQLTQEHSQATREEESETAVASWIRQTVQPQQKSAAGGACAARSNGSDDGGASIGDGAESVGKGDASGGSNLEAGLLPDP